MVVSSKFPIITYKTEASYLQCFNSLRPIYTDKVQHYNVRIQVAVLRYNERC